MNVSKKILCLSVVLFVGVSSLLWAGAEPPSERVLNFAPGPTVEWHSMAGLYGDGLLGGRPAAMPVAYAASLRIGLRQGETIQNVSYLHNAIREGFGGRLESAVSQEQRDFLRDYPADTLRITEQEREVEVTLYATSEADARAMATACIRWMDQIARARQASLRQDLAQLKQDEGELTQRVARLTEAEEALKGNLNGLKEETYHLGADEAAEAGRQLNQEAQMLQIELRGIEARIDAIAKERASLASGQRFRLSVRSDVLSQLAILEVTENVNAAGVVARIRAAEEARDLAINYVQVNREYLSARQDRQAEARKLEANQEHIARRERLLGNPPFDCRAPELLGDAVLIHPVEANSSR